MATEVSEIQAYIEQCESLGRFDEHTTSPELSLSLPVDGSYNYLQTGFFNFFKKRLAHAVDYFFEKKTVRDLFDLEIKGRENLEGVPNSIVVCNHVHMFDCIIVRQAYNRKNIYITAAQFNNRSDFLGFLMRYNEMLPFSSNRKAQCNMNSAIEKILKGKSGHILVYPEASEWLYYKKPRPFKPGAFHYAAKHNVPVQPMFITFSEEERRDKKGNPAPKATLNILPPIYPDSNLSRRENKVSLSAAAYDSMKKCYEETYGVELRYSFSS